jgi:hypothetical protein
MEKEEFIDVAPAYYATAIIAFLDRRGRSVSREQISKEYSFFDEEAKEAWYYFARDRLFDEALELLLNRDLIEVTRDPFGPPIISRGVDLYKKLQTLAKDSSFPYYKYCLIIDGESWLREALQELESV